MVFQRESGSLLRYFQRRLDEPADAADLLGEVMLVACRRPEQIPAGEEPSRMWLFGVARRVLATHRRGHGRRLRLADRLRDDLVVVPEVHEDHEGASLREALRALPDGDRELLMLLHWDGFTPDEAAVILDTKPSTIRSRSARARERLRRALG